jgi:DNA-binding Xre family transcriptional regulator
VLNLELIESRQAALGLSQQEVSARAGRNHNWLANMLVGVRLRGRKVHPKTLGTLARALECRPEDLIAKSE